MKRDAPRNLPKEACSHCWKPAELCLCKAIKSVATRHRILILQHPRETRSPLGTAPLASLYLQNSVHRIGLSWRSLSAALGENADPNQWAVLYLGTKKKSQNQKPQTQKTQKQIRNAVPPGPDDLAAAPKPVHEEVPPFQVFSARGKLMSRQTVKGVVILDGNWEQSKTLWWRNPWLLRIATIQLRPETTSMYGKMRRQPRKHCLSSLEAAAATLENLGEDKKVTDGLKDLMSQLLAKASAAKITARSPIGFNSTSQPLA